MSSRGSDKGRSRKVSRGRNARPDESQLNDLVALIENNVRGRTNVEIGKAANVAPSTISMILNKKRVPTVSVLRHLAKALCPPASPLEEFTQELLRLAGHDPAAVHRTSESTLERVRRTGIIRAALIVNEPFVDRNKQGFAVDLFKALARIAKVDYDLKIRHLHELRNLVEGNEFDIVVSALLPTFGRRGYMSFSTPFPYLRVPLSAVVRDGIKVDRRDLNLRDVLGWTNATAVGLKEVGKILLVRGEVGDEFVSTFLPGVDRTNPSQVELVDTLDPNMLYERLTSPEKEAPRLLLADMATCINVWNRDPKRTKVKPLAKAFDDSDGQPKVEAHREFPVLAQYPIAFGFSKGDQPWKDFINLAMDSLMSEGVMIVYTLFERYLKNARDVVFKDFILPDDDQVQLRSRDIFSKLFGETIPHGADDHGRNDVE